MTPDPTPAPFVLRLEGISFRHPDSDWLFRDLTLDIKHGEVVALVGASGCGKSTLLRVAAGLAPIEGGRRLCNARTITQVFQTPRLLPWRDAAANVELLLEIGDGSRVGDAAATAHGRSHQLLEAVGLAGAGSLTPRQMSLGMQMRVALARALAPSPDFMLLDEPFAAVDEPTRLRLDRLFVEVVARERCGALYVTHSAREAVSVADRVVVLGSNGAGVLHETSVPRGSDTGRPERTRLEVEIAAQIELAAGGGS